jgi:hypothetical protein
MTPEEISKLSNEQLNELIAVKRGYEVISRINGSPVTWAIRKDGYLSMIGGLPDYCNSWQWAGELLEEIIAKMNLTKIVVFRDEIDHCEAEFWLVDEKYLTLTWHKSDSPTRAISEAWYLMEGE